MGLVVTPLHEPSTCLNMLNITLIPSKCLNMTRSEGSNFYFSFSSLFVFPHPRPPSLSLPPHLPPPPCLICHRGCG